MTVRSTSFDLPYFGNVLSWEKTVTAPQTHTPGSYCYFSRITAGENRTLATVSLNEMNSSSRADIRSYLFDESGIEIANFSLVHEEVVLNGTDDRFNGTYGSIDGSRYVAGTFWVVGHSFRAVNGTAILRSWGLRVNATDGSSTSYELRRLTLPYLANNYGIFSEGDPWFDFYQVTEADSSSLLVVSSAGQGYMAKDPSDGWRPYVLSGNLTASRFMADGSIDFAVSLHDYPTGVISPGRMFLFGNLISMYEGAPTIFIPDFYSDFYSVRFGGPTQIKTFTVTQPTHAVEVGEFTLGSTEILFFLTCLMQYSNSFLCVGAGMDQGTAEIAGEAIYEDQGIFGWRDERPAFVRAPAILRLDARSGTSAIILLAQPIRPPDTLAGLLAVAVTAIAAVALLTLGYPILRARRIIKVGRNEQLVEPKNLR